MKSNIKISVIVPCYNVAQWLPKCLDSILGQTYSNLEVIAINDGSTDTTGEIIDRYRSKDPRVIAVHQENAGLVAVRDKGIELATGEYVGFVDGDDVIVPDMYERLLHNALEYEADISHCGISFVNMDGTSNDHYETGRLILQDNFSGVRDLLLGEQIEPSLCNKLYAKKLLHSSTLDTTVLNNEDLLRNYTLFGRAEKSVYEDFCGYKYMQRPGSMSKDAAKAVQIFHHVAKARKTIVDNCSEDIRPYALRLWLSTYVNQINQNYSSLESKIQELNKECRKLLKQERNNIPYLVRRQQLAAYLILYAPWLHRLVYGLYSNRR